MRLALIVLAIACAAPAGAADTWHVSPAGRDGDDGRTPQTAWKTVAKVNATLFPPGSRILFARGGEWRESLVVGKGSKGAPGSPLVFEAYGNGAKPRFLGSDVLANARFAPAGAGAWSYELPGLPAGQVYALQDHRFIGTGPAAYAGSTLTIASASDPRSDGRVYTVCRRGNVIACSRSAHVQFRNLVADETAGQMGDGTVQGYGIRIEGCSDVLVEDCEVYRAGRHHIGVINSTDFTGRRITCAHAAPAIEGGSSLFVSYADQGAPVAKCAHRWLDCVSAHAEAGNGGTYEAFIAHGENQGALSFENFRADGGKVSLMCAPVSFTGGVLSGGARLENFGDGALVDGTLFKDRAFVDQWGARGTFQNLVFAQGTPGESGAIIIRPGKAGNVVRFCTFALAGHECLALYGAAPGTRWYGNIMPGTAVSGGDPGDVAFADGNLYGAAATIMGRPLAEWRALGKDAHARSGDPLFTAARDGDFTLQAASPAVDAAGEIPATDVPPSDAAGAGRPAGKGPDAGAFERGGRQLPRR
jgi:hypothetical protein